MNELQLYNDVIIFAIHKLNDLMTDKRTQNIKQFLSELSGKALAYLFPGVDKATIDEQSHAHLTEVDVAYSVIESPFPMCPQPKVPAEESIDFAQFFFKDYLVGLRHRQTASKLLNFCMEATTATLFQ